MFKFIPMIIAFVGICNANTNVKQPHHPTKPSIIINTPDTVVVPEYSINEKSTASVIHDIIVEKTDAIQKEVAAYKQNAERDLDNLKKRIKNEFFVKPDTRWQFFTKSVFSNVLLSTTILSFYGIHKLFNNVNINDVHQKRFMAIGVVNAALLTFLDMVTHHKDKKDTSKQSEYFKTFVTSFITPMGAEAGLNLMGVTNDKSPKSTESTGAFMVSALVAKGILDLWTYTHSFIKPITIYYHGK
jgi:hypothetical protein